MRSQIPAVIVVLVLLGVFVLTWTRTNVLSRLWGMASRSRNTPATTTREITATQLAGATNAGRTTTTTTATTRPARAGRRTRRTPSQMSVTSLPVYMKEPGDQELVIFRCVSLCTLYSFLTLFQWARGNGRCLRCHCRSARGGRCR